MTRYVVQRCLMFFVIAMGVSWAVMPASASAAEQGLSEFDMLKSIDEINKRLDEVETKAMMDKMNFGAEVRTRFDWYDYKIDADETTGAEEIDESVNGLASTQVRLNLRADVSDQLRFTGRLAMYKLWGDKTLHTTYDDLSAGREPTDTRLWVERAYVDYFFNIWKVPMALSFGRLPTTDGMPTDLREDSPRKSTYPSLAWDAQVDGLSLSFGLDKLTRLPGSRLTLTYTDWITDYENAPYREVTMYGYDFPTSTPIYAGQFEAGLPGFLDGTSFMLDFLYAPSVQLRDDTVESLRNGIARSLEAATWANFGVGYPYDVTITGVEAPNSMGSIMKAVAFVESKNFLNTWVDWFAGYAWEKTKPNGQLVLSYVWDSLSPADPTVPISSSAVQRYPTAFMSSTGDEDLTARAYHAGLRLNLPIRALGYPKLGFEYNHASEHWYGFTYASEDPLHKLEERGSVYDAYYIQPISRYFKTRVGYTLIKRDYDPNPYGDPIKNEATISNMYILLDVRF